jgi:subtilisin family serine protease
MPPEDPTSQIINATDDANDAEGAPAFVANDQTLEPTNYVPGLIEIQLKDHVKPQVSSLSELNAPTADMGQLNAVLQTLNVQNIEPAFWQQADSSNSGDTASSIPDSALADFPDLSNFLRVQLPEETDLAEAVGKLLEVPEILAAVPVPVAIPASITGDPLTGSSDQLASDPSTGLESQWYIYRCGFDKAWEQSDGSQVVVADIDFGYRLSHEDIAPNVNSARAFNSFDGSTNVGQGGKIFHGTGVLGLMGASLNSKGMVGTAFAAELWPIQANTGASQLPGNAFANAIEWVCGQDSGGKRKVINLEVQTGAFGNYEQIPSVNLAIRRAIARNVVVCVAAGNGNRDATIADDNLTPIPPTGSILVGATVYDPADNPRAWFSNFGSTVVVSAPGDSDHDVTCSASADTAYTNKFGGTSGATPKVAGTVALMLAVNPALSHDDIRDALFITGKRVTTAPDKPVGSFLSAEGAVAHAKEVLTQ